MLEMALKVSASLDYISTIRNTIASFVLISEPVVDDIVEIKTIVSEALTNSIIHGYNEDDSQTVSIFVSIDRHLLTMVFQDEGVGIENIELAKKPMYSSKKELEHAGMGLTIIEALCNEMILESSKQGTKLIVKRVLPDE